LADGSLSESRAETLFTVLQGCFHLFMFGNVDHQTYQSPNFPFRIRNDADDVAQPYHPTISCQSPILKPVVSSFIDCSFAKGDGLLTVLGMKMFNPETGFFQPLFDRIPEDGFGSLAHKAELQRGRISFPHYSVEAMN
jgi:hypothetical protein